MFRILSRVPNRSRRNGDTFSLSDESPDIESTSDPDFGTPLVTEPVAETTPLLRRVIHGSAWMLGLRVALRSVRFVRNIILARILAPDDLGLFAMALLVLSVIERFSNTGVTQALVQRRHAIEEYLDTAWTVLIIRSVGLAAILLVVAQPIAEFFQEPGVAPLIRALACTVLIRGVKNPGVICLQRQLDFRRQFMLRFGGTFVELLVSVPAAIVMRSAWALMIGLIVGSMASLLFSYHVHPYRPRLQLNFHQVWDLTPFGVWIFLDDMLFFLAYRGDSLIVGKLLGSAALGAYVLAYGMGDAITTEFGRVITEVAFPAYSRMQDHLVRVRKALCMSLEMASCVAAPAAVLLYFGAEAITSVVLGERWLAVATVLPPLALAGAARSVLVNMAAAFKGVGQPSHAFRLNLIGVAVTYCMVYPLVMRMGLAGVGWAVFAGVVAMLPFAAYSGRQLLQLSMSDLTYSLLPGGALALLVSVPLALFHRYYESGDVVALLVLLAMTGTLFAAGVVLLWTRFRRGPLQIRALMAKSRRRTAEAASAV